MVMMTAGLDTSLCILALVELCEFNARSRFSKLGGLRYRRTLLNNTLRPADSKRPLSRGQHLSSDVGVCGALRVISADR